MSNVTLIIGESGSGKSTSIRNLNPNETFIVNVINKPLPFKAFLRNYHKLSSDGSTGNYYSSDNYQNVKRVIKLIEEKRTDIKTLIIDDFQYMMCNEFMRRSSEKGYEKFTEIGRNAWEVIDMLGKCRDNLDCFVLSHSEMTSDGTYKCKTIGKMLDDKITIEGLFTIVLHACLVDGEYRFITQNDGSHLAKSPLEMFDDKYIQNDLCYVKNKIKEYFNTAENEVYLHEAA